MKWCNDTITHLVVEMKLPTTCHMVSVHDYMSNAIHASGTSITINEENSYSFSVFNFKANMNITFSEATHVKVGSIYH
jgi:hypothetical protein